MPRPRGRATLAARPRAGRTAHHRAEQAQAWAAGAEARRHRRDARGRQRPASPVAGRAAGRCAGWSPLWGRPCGPPAARCGTQTRFGCLCKGRSTARGTEGRCLPQHSTPEHTGRSTGGRMEWQRSALAAQGTRGTAAPGPPHPPLRASWPCAVANLGGGAPNLGSARSAQEASPAPLHTRSSTSRVARVAPAHWRRVLDRRTC